jgi:hypothetical protein
MIAMLDDIWMMSDERIGQDLLGYEWMCTIVCTVLYCSISSVLSQYSSSSMQEQAGLKKQICHFGSVCPQ